MALLQNVILRGTHASRPAAGAAGVLYFETDTGQLFRDSGSAWELVDTTVLYTAKGQLLAASAAAAVGALAAGTDGDQLTADSTQTLGVKWAQSAAVRAYHNSSQTVASNTLTQLALNSTRFDQGTATAQHSTSSNTSRLTCRVAGVYLITGTVELGTFSASQVQLRVTLNGATIIALDNAHGDASGLTNYRTMSTLYQLSVGDYVELGVFHQIGSTLTINSNGNWSPEFGMARLA